MVTSQTDAKASFLCTADIEQLNKEQTGGASKDVPFSFNEEERR